MRTVEQIKKVAWDNPNQVPDNTWTMPEALLWYQMWRIYRLFRDGNSRESLEIQTSASAMAFESNKEIVESYKRVLRLHAKMYQDIEVAVDAYRLNPTIENADKALDIIYGTVTKDRN